MYSTPVVLTVGFDASTIGLSHASAVQSKRRQHCAPRRAKSALSLQLGSQSSVSSIITSDYSCNISETGSGRSNLESPRSTESGLSDSGSWASCAAAGARALPATVHEDGEQQLNGVSRALDIPYTRCEAFWGAHTAVFGWGGSSLRRRA